MKVLLSGIIIVAALLLVTAPSLTMVSQVLAQSDENIVEQTNTDSIGNIEGGSLAVNFARNLAEFTDSNFNTLIQDNDQGIEDVSEGSEANNEGSNLDVSLGSSDFNTVTQENKQGIEDVSEGSEANNEGSNTANLGFDSDNNDVGQNNDQDIEDIDDESNASNDAENSVNFNCPDCS